MVEEESVQLTLTSTTVFTRLEEAQVRAFCSTHEHGVRNVYLPLQFLDRTTYRWESHMQYDKEGISLGDVKAENSS